MGVIQVLTIPLSRLKRAQINFFIVGVIAFATIRPNILGETFGLIGPLYFYILMQLTRVLPPEYTVNNSQVIKVRNFFASALVITFLYWIYVLIITSFRVYQFSIWPTVANLGTIGIDSYLIFQIYKRGALVRLVSVFLYFVSFQAVAFLMSKYFFHYSFCTSINVGRGWDYSMCLPGAIIVSRTRLTGFGGEPSIFAFYLCLAVILLWWPHFRLSIFTKLTLTVVLVIASLNSEATTGTVMIFLAVALIPFQSFHLKNASFLLTTYTATIYYFVSTDVVQSFIRQVFDEKIKNNRGSITDRNLNLDFSHYIRAWTENPFGSQWDGNVLASGRGINSLSDSLNYGPAILAFFLSLIVVCVVLAQHSIRMLSIGLLIALTNLFLQPSLKNPIWTILLCIHFSLDSIQKFNKKATTGIR